MNTDFEKQIENLPKKGNSIKDKLFNKDYFLRSSEFGISTIDKEKIIFDSKKSSLGNFVLAGTAAIVVSFRFKESIVTYSAIIIIVIAMTLGYFFTLKRKSKVIKINKIGFEIENIKFEWDDIYDFGALVKPTRHITYYELIIFSKTKGKKVYSLYNYQSERDDILKNLNYFKEKFETNKNIS
ncbi:hypothetical protein [Flavobacterium sp.]|jgi:hypothetical protein|uniref:hypothetical protein n=1 Tax=Flavobacterium sp. TaxID=239 RepID=UPI0040483D4D